MNDEPNDLWRALKCVWLEQQSSGGPALTADEQIAVLRQKMAKMHPGLNKTDLWGAALYALVTVPFIIYVITTPNVTVRTGYLILIGGMLFASWKSIWRRRSIAQPIADAPVMEWLKYDLAKVRQHAEASRTLLWWYLLPFLVGMCVATWGMPIDLVARIGMSAMTALFVGVTDWLNRRVWRQQWIPMQRELEALLNPDPPVSPSEAPKKT